MKQEGARQQTHRTSNRRSSASYCFLISSCCPGSRRVAPAAPPPDLLGEFSGHIIDRKQTMYRTVFRFNSIWVSASLVDDFRDVVHPVTVFCCPVGQFIRHNILHEIAAEGCGSGTDEPA